jgi:hypothetical protein
MQQALASVITHIIELAGQLETRGRGPHNHFADRSSSILLILILTISMENLIVPQIVKKFPLS